MTKWRIGDDEERMMAQLEGYRKLGFNVRIFPEARLVLRGGIEIGSNVIIDDFAFIVGGKPGDPLVSIGDYCHIASHTSFTGGGELVLGDFTSYGSGTKIVTGSEYFTEGTYLTNPTVPAPWRQAKRSFVRIGKHSILGLNVTVMPGVTIGEGCAVGANTLVLKDLAPWGIYAGQPARRLAERPKERILQLEEALREEERNRPMVTVLIMTCNQEAYIGQAIESALMQRTSFPIEIVVHDDASTDRTPEIVRGYAERFPTIVKPIFQAQNQLSKTGRYPTLYAYEMAKGRYIAECDGDDYWTDPLKLAKQVAFMEKNTKAALCHHAYEILEHGTFKRPSRELPRDFSADELVGMPISGYGIGGCTKLYRNYYSTATRRDFLNFNGDYPMNVLLGMHGSAKFLHDIRPSVYRRMNGTNSWCSLPGAVKAQKTKEMQKRLYELILEKGNERWTQARRAFL